MCCSAAVSRDDESGDEEMAQIRSLLNSSTPRSTVKHSTPMSTANHSTPESQHVNDSSKAATLPTPINISAVLPEDDAQFPGSISAASVETFPGAAQVTQDPNAQVPITAVVNSSGALEVAAEEVDEDPNAVDVPAADAAAGEEGTEQGNAEQQVLHNNNVLAATTETKKGSSYDYLVTSFALLENPPIYVKEEMWYLIYQREVCPDTHREHWQLFVQFMSRVTYKQAKFYLRCGKMKLFSRKGTPLQCKQYCSKDLTRMPGTAYVEEGFMQPRTRGVNAYAVYTAAQKAKGRSDESLLNDTLCAEYMARQKVLVSSEVYSGMRLCYVLTGVTGIGKSEMMRQVAEVIAKHRNWKVYFKDDSQWWQDYAGQEIAVFNEFDMIYPFGCFKQLVDGYPIPLYSKHGASRSNVHIVLICSNFHPYQFYPKQPKRAAALRRLQKSWKLPQQKDQSRVGKEIVDKITDDLYHLHLGDINPFPYRQKLVESYTDQLALSLDKFKHDEEFMKTWHDIPTVTEPGTCSEVTEAVPPSQLNSTLPIIPPLSDSASMVVGDQTMPSFSSPTSAVFSPTSAVFSPVQTPPIVPSLPLTKSVLQKHDQWSADEHQRRATRAQDEDEENLFIECGPSASPFTRMLVDRANGVEREPNISRTASEASSEIENEFFCSPGASPYTKKRVSKARLAMAMPPLKDLTNKSLPSPNAARQPPKSPVKITQSQSDVCRPPAKMFIKRYRLTVGVIADARLHNYTVVWVHRGRSRYYLIFYETKAFHLFINTNTSDLSKGLSTIDECKMSDLQKPHLDIEADKQLFQDVSADFCTGSHVDMLLTTITSFVAAITKVHGHPVLQSDLAIYSSCRDGKISFHVVYPVGRFPTKLVYRIAELTKNALVKSYVDMNIYTDKHQLRMYGSCKWNRNNPDSDEKDKRCTAASVVADKNSMKYKINTAELLDNSRIVPLPLDMSASLVMESWITDSNSPSLVFVTPDIPPQLATRAPARARSCVTPSPRHSSRSTGNFYKDNAKTNLYDIIKKAAEFLCGGTFLVREEEVPCSKYVMYYVDRTLKGPCRQCHVTHDRDNAQCSLLRVDTAIAEIYKLSITCHRFKPPISIHKWKQVYTIMKVRGAWKIKN